MTKLLRATWQESLDDLLALEPDWDSYGALAINTADVRAARRLIERTLADGARIPTIAPHPHGGVHLEWSSLAHELEAEVVDGKWTHYRESFVEPVAISEEVDPSSEDEIASIIAACFSS